MRAHRGGQPDAAQRAHGTTSRPSPGSTSATLRRRVQVDSIAVGVLRAVDLRPDRPGPGGDPDDRGTGHVAVAHRSPPPAYRPVHRAEPSMTIAVSRSGSRIAGVWSRGKNGRDPPQALLR